jgi:conjugative transfer signal peptidase TraF
MTNHPLMLVTVVAGVSVIETILSPKPAPRFVWNVSESVPTGLYQVQPARDLIVTTLVVAYPPEPLATLLEDGGYLPRDVPLIKRILALPGQTVCRTGPSVAVDGFVMGVARERDHRGRVLPVWEGCHILAGDELFLMNWDEPASLDGRYFGPIPLNAVVGRAVLLWTFEEN